MSSIHEWKYGILLTALAAVAVLEPLAVKWSDRIQIVTDIIAVVINIGVLLVIYERRWERGLAFVLLTLALAANFYHEVSANPLQLGAIAFHGLAALFLVFAVAVILQRIFQRKTIRTDDVIGALCGYLLAGAAWANIYGLVYLISPASYRIADGIAAQLGNWHLQRFLFDYFSIMTLTTLGFSDIAPVGPAVYSLILAESVFGQFYIAVVVAQLVGLRLAQAIKPDG